MTDGVEQNLRAFHIRGHELGGAFGDRLLDVALGRRAHDDVHLGDDVFHEPRIPDVAVYERQPLVVHHVGEVGDVARVRERVEGDDVVRRVLEQVADEVRRDEPAAAGDEDALPPLHCSSRSIV